MSGATTRGGTVGGVVLDIEGTTTPAAFVYDTLFPYARAQLRRYLREHAATPEVREAIRLLRAEHDLDDAHGDMAPAWVEGPTGVTIDSLGGYLEWLMDRDRKSTGLKLIQGYVWERGYADGTLCGEVYPDVPPALERWRRDGLTLSIYSSGSVLGQRLLFAHSAAGDLTRFISHYFDTGVGPKRSAQSYESIADAIGLPAGELLFVSDVVPELDAARAAGFQTRLCVRGDVMATPPGASDVIRTFDEIEW